MWFDCISNFVSIWKTLWIGGTWYLSLQSRPSLICKTLKYKNPLPQVMHLIKPNRPVKNSMKTVKKSIWGRQHRSLGFPSVYLFLELDQQFCILAAASFSYFIYLEDVFIWVRKVRWRSENSLNIENLKCGRKHKTKYQGVRIYDFLLFLLFCRVGMKKLSNGEWRLSLFVESME